MSLNPGALLGCYNSFAGLPGVTKGNSGEDTCGVSGAAPTLGLVHDLKVFVADDNEGDVRLLSEAFALLNRRTSVKHVRSARDTLALLRTLEPGQFDLIILDYNLPPETVVEMFEELGIAPGALGPPVVIWSSPIPPQPKQRLIESGVALVAVKPHGLTGLRELAHKLLELVEGRRAES